MRLNYNISKTGATPPVPNESMQRYIEEALRYYKVIE
jgi:hypothetical protein